jgi:putative aminopeptidase FrvX
MLFLLMPVSLSFVIATGFLVFCLGMEGCARGDTPGGTERDPAGTALVGSEKMDAPLRRALRDTGNADDHRFDLLLGVAGETAADAGAFMALQQDLRTAGFTVRTISGSTVTVRGTRTAIATAAADERISSLQLSATRSF